jgi:hypothetical protein
MNLPCFSKVILPTPDFAEAEFRIWPGKQIYAGLILERYFKNHTRSGGLSFIIFQIKNLKFDFVL